MNIIQAVVSVLLFFVLFFGISFLVNMLLRQTWLVAFIYPLIVIFIVDNIALADYFLSFTQSIQTALSHLVNLQVIDIVILSSGLAGAICSGIVIRMLRVRGYQMF
ncbi:membrane protein [Pontibacillus yanchengensis Y32]|uniref:Membrane protein n=1 Tax=Pontibacillus yanchengensis Y32 TaxID=1385514 RepID=A0A0A2T8R4_9BACI|nr:YuiB family protein [Pontibacillus yanchengensis]KGP70798.1 membrane protein [Pontibacillus yanchengensis Y32]